MFSPFGDPLYNTDNALDAEDLCPELVSLYPAAAKQVEPASIPFTEEECTV